jgi:hypothetical protein
MAEIARQGELEAFDFWKQTGDGRWNSWWLERRSQVEFWRVIAHNGVW